MNRSKNIKNSPLVSVIIPTYNGESTILRAINSVLNQTYSNLELIVVDDCSKDNTFEVVKNVKDKRVKVLRHKENRGGSAARNTGIKEAKGEYIAFLDDDDEWLSEKVEKQVEYLKSKESSLYKGVVCSHMILSGKKWRTVIQTKEGDLREDILLMRLSLAAGSCLMVNRYVFNDIGMFNESYLRHQDMEFVLRYLRKYKLGVMEEPLAKIYGHSGNVSGEKMLEVKSKFLKDFEKDINSFGKKVAKKIYARQWLQVSKHYALDGDIKNTFKYLHTSLSYGILFSNRYKFLILENYIALPYHLLKGLVKRKRYER